MSNIENNLEEMYALWLCSIPGFGRITIGKLLSEYGSFEDIYKTRDLSEDTLAARKTRKSKQGEEPGSMLNTRQLKNFLCFKKKFSPMELLEKNQKKGVSFVSCKSPLFPKKLSEIADTPAGLFFLGKLPDPSVPSVSIIGARMCSEYGRYVAREFGEALASAGIQVISGLARGIDGISQKAAVESDGTSFAIMGCGVDICYPEENLEIYKALQEKGGIISEYPPGTNPSPGLFPLRNRIISGLSDAVLVVEAKKKSGTLITVDMALEQGREVFAVPGRITDRLSDGCNDLIRQGANIVMTPDDVISMFATGDDDSCSGGSDGTQDNERCGVLTRLQLSEQEKRVLTILDLNPKAISSIHEELGNMGTALSIQAMLDTLVHLSIKGLVISDGGYYRLASSLAKSLFTLS